MKTLTKIQNNIRLFNKRLTNALDWGIERLSDPHSQVRMLKDRLAYERIINGNTRDQRPRLDEIYNNSSEEPSVQMPRTPYTAWDIRNVYHATPIIKRCVMAIREEVFRNGLEIEPLFAGKCMVCGEEYDHIPESGVCSSEEGGVVCGGKIRKPKRGEKQELEKFFKAVNENKQTFTELLKTLEDDINIHDDCWLIARQSYILNEFGDIISRQIKEIVRGSPMYMRYVHDNTGRLGYKWGVCLRHRDVKDLQNYGDGFCKICGGKLHNVVAVSTSVGGRGSTPETYYIDGEVFHASKYSPSILGGYSPIATLWDTALSLVKMVEYIYSGYDHKRTPNGVIEVKTNNIDSVLSNWKKELQTLKQDRNHIPLIGVDPVSGSNGINYVKFMDTIAELEYIDVRNEFKREIGALYGVEPIFMNDASTGGGLNNEGLQITVTNRAVESAQRIWNDMVIPSVVELLGVGDYRVFLLPSEEQDEAHDLDLEFKRIQNAQGMALLGFDVDLNDDLEFMYTKVEASNVVDEDLFTDGSNVLGTAGMPNPVRNLKKKASKVRLTKGILDNAVKAIKLGALWGEYKTLSESDTNLVKKILTNAFSNIGDGIDSKSVIKQLVDKTGLTAFEAERLYRTEEQAVVLKARELFYTSEDPSGEYRYTWVGPKDKRTTGICKAISLRASKGVSLKRLREIIKEEATNPNNLGGGKSTYQSFRPYSPHINCRHIYTRKV